MKTIALSLLAATAMVFVAAPASARDANYYGVKNERHSMSIRHARASYAYAPHRRHARHRGATINARDPIRRALDDPYMYGRPDRH